MFKFLLKKLAVLNEQTKAESADKFSTAVAALDRQLALLDALEASPGVLTPEDEQLTYLIGQEALNIRKMLQNQV